MAQFRPMARIISHLGERLISSSKVALLELIKNSYDAKSPVVEITVDQVKKELIIYDEGKGMNSRTIEDHWLVVGTTHRLEDKDDDDTDDFPLGEKGLGRFSTMKLGNYLLLETTTSDSDAIFNLEIDWNQYSYRSKLFLDEVDNKLYSTPKNSTPSTFTRITIRGITDFIGPSWTEREVYDFVSDVARKFTNPYKQLPRRFDVYINFISHDGKKHRWKVGHADFDLLNQAHYEIYGKYAPGELEMTYKVRREGKVVETDSIIIDKIQNEVRDPKRDGYVGEFEYHFYIFNRTTTRLQEVTGFNNIRVLRKTLDHYTVGPMIFRDGFRIYPYGEQGDDWMELNKERFRSGKGKIVREQTAGFIAVNSKKAPYLVDQTNREGLVHNHSFENFKHVVKEIFSTLVSIIGKQEDTTTYKDTISSAQSSAKTIQRTLKLATLNDNALTHEQMNEVLTNSQKIGKYLERINDKDKSLVELSAIGMTALQIAHEVHNFTNKILSIIASIKLHIPKNLSANFDLLELNMKSLRTMVSQIDEQAATLKRVKSSIDIVGQIRAICRDMESVTTKYNRKFVFNVHSNVDKVIAKVNKGLLIQLFDNLILNSLYWIDVGKTLKDNENGEITIEIHEDGSVYFSDNGPGILKIDAQSIFEPLFSRRVGGRGLGLFICKEIAAFHKIGIELTSIENQYGRLGTFRIDFSNVVGEDIVK